MKNNSGNQEGFASVNGAQLYYEVKGQGLPMLLIHAGVADSRMWDAQFEAFSTRYRVARFDMRGFGRSKLPAGSFSNIEDVRALLDYLDMDEAIIIGVSFGGLVALDFTLAYPQRVKALVLGAPSVSGMAPPDRVRQFWQEEEAALNAGDLAGATEINLRLWVDGPQREPDEVDPALRALVGEMQLAAFQQAAPDDADEIEPETPAVERLGEVKPPVLALVGALDLPEKVALLDRLAAEIPDCRTVVIPDVAHMLNMEMPALFNGHVLGFLGERAIA